MYDFSAARKFAETAVIPSTVVNVFTLVTCRSSAIKVELVSFVVISD